MTAKDRDAPTIECECCKGRGSAIIMRLSDGEDLYGMCPLCSGTGREPSTVTPRTTEKTP